jgi:hypothetical protein
MTILANTFLICDYVIGSLGSVPVTLLMHCDDHLYDDNFDMQKIAKEKDDSGKRPDFSEAQKYLVTVLIAGHTVDSGKALSWRDDLANIDLNSSVGPINEKSNQTEMSIYSLGIGGSHLLCVREGKGVRDDFSRMKYEAESFEEPLSFVLSSPPSLFNADYDDVNSLVAQAICCIFSSLRLKEQTAIVGESIKDTVDRDSDGIKSIALVADTIALMLLIQAEVWSSNQI